MYSSLGIGPFDIKVIPFAGNRRSDRIFYSDQYLVPLVVSHMMTTKYVLCDVVYCIYTKKIGSLPQTIDYLVFDTIHNSGYT